MKGVLMKKLNIVQSNEDFSKIINKGKCLKDRNLVIYSLLNIKNKGAAKTWHKSSAINCNRFQEDGFHYIIYSPSTPVSDLRVKI